MTDFILYFLICNLWISAMILTLFAIRRLLKTRLTSRTQYHLWFLPLCLMAVPFIPVPSDRTFSLFSWFTGFIHETSPGSTAGDAASTLNSMDTVSGWMNDFTVSVTRQTPSLVGRLLFGIWIIGMLTMVLFVLRSFLRLRRIKKSALPLQNREVKKLYKRCLEEMHIRKKIPIYSTAFLKSPVLTGLINPCIYLPIRLISDYNSEAIRYMLLHELQHYRHKDNLVNYLLLSAQILYWFNPFVWFAGKTMRCDREIACDSAVLNMLDTGSYQDYGYTLINFAEKISLSPFSSSLGGTVKQLEQRIQNIALYQKPSFLHSFENNFSCLYLVHHSLIFYLH